MFELDQPTRLQEIQDDFLTSNRIRLFIKRDDMIHPEISGNKWRKLKYNFIDAREKGINKILTFGGAYSNHIAATASAASKYNFESIGIVRGEELNSDSNPTLKRAHGAGMQLKFVTRRTYKRRNEKELMDELVKEFGDFYVIPEGGSNNLAVRGCSEISREIDIDFDYIISAVGTGGTLAGLACGIKDHQMAIGISALKGAHYLSQEVEGHIDSFLGRKLKNWKINHDYHLGGYARYTDQLIEFINQFQFNQHIQLDPIYTGKMMMATYDLIEKKIIEPESRIVALHTGGLQGIEGFNRVNGELIQLRN